jgi:hypothetical protein
LRLRDRFDAGASRSFRNRRPGRASKEHMAAERSRLHWPEYLIEACALGTFMVSAAGFAAVLYHPASVVATAIASEWVRRGLMGLAMARRPCSSSIHRGASAPART